MLFTYGDVSDPLVAQVQYNYVNLASVLQSIFLRPYISGLGFLLLHLGPFLL